MNDCADGKREHVGEWYEIDAPWDSLGYASVKLMDLGQTREWCELVDEVAGSTHATANEVWDGMASAVTSYLEGLS